MAVRRARSLQLRLTAERNADFECVWFYATPTDFAFRPGNYNATLRADGILLGSAAFAIGA